MSVENVDESLKNSRRGWVGSGIFFSQHAQDEVNDDRIKVHDVLGDLFVVEFVVLDAFKDINGVLCWIHGPHPHMQVINIPQYSVPYDVLVRTTRQGE